MFNRVTRFVEIHPSGVLRNLLIVPRAFDFLSKHKKLMGAKGLWKILKASWRLMHTGLGFITAYGEILQSINLSATAGVIRMTACFLPATVLRAASGVS